MRKKLEQARAGTLDVKMAHFQFFRSFGENSEQIIKKFQEQAYGDPDDQPSANVEVKKKGSPPSRLKNGALWP